jgi:hypothetical protein
MNLIAYPLENEEINLWLSQDNAMSHTSWPRFGKVGVANSRTIGAGPWGVKQEILKDCFRNTATKLRRNCPARQHEAV